MKKRYFLPALIVFAAMMSHLQAQTDVTATYLQNPGFDEAPIHYTVTGGTVLTAGVERIGVTGTHGWTFPIPGWNQESIINANAVQISTGEYGTVANSQGFNNIPVPATDKAGASAGAAVSMSAGWGDRAMLSQNVTLPSGRYVLKYDIHNGHTALNAVVNYSGFIPATGTATYGTRLIYAQNTWFTDSVSFYLIDQTEGKINLGYTTSSGSSNNGPKFFIDNVKLLYYGIDKSTLKQWIDSATVVKNDPKDVGTSNVYTELDNAIGAAQAIYDKVNATAAEVVGMEEALKEAINKVFGAITLQTRVNTWKPLPYNATEAIVNPGFENAITLPWNNEGNFARQTNASFDPFKAGTAYAERWVTSGTALSNLRITQMVRNIPNGVYVVTVSAHAVQQLDNSYPGGAFLYANGGVTEIFERKDYVLTTEVADNTLEIGIEVAESGNWVAFDNFRLSYVSDGSPFLVISPDKLSFTPVTNERTFNVFGGNLTNDVSLNTSPAFTLSKTTLTAAEVMADGGVNITINSTSTQAIAQDSIVIAHGDVKSKIMLSVNETLTVSTASVFLDQSIDPQGSFEVKGDLFGAVTLTSPEGIFLTKTNISAAEAQIGDVVAFLWDGETSVKEKFIYINSGSKKDSVLVFAVSNNLISTWDGNDSEGEGSRITDFGWTLTAADGITNVAGSFNVYAATSGIRYVPVTNQNYTHRGKPWSGKRLAYLRTWGDPATNVYNLPVELTQGVRYSFRGVSAWHDNETNPTFKWAVNSAQANTGDTLAIQSFAHTVKRAAADYNFSFVAKTSGMHYLTLSSTVRNDVMCSPLYLAIYQDADNTSTELVNDNYFRVYPTVTNGSVSIETGGAAGMVRVFDITGKLTATKVLNGSVEQIELPASGAYFFRIDAGNTSKTVKVISVK
jgi:hypothetical protein